MSVNLLGLPTDRLRTAQDREHQGQLQDLSGFTVEVRCPLGPIFLISAPKDPKIWRKG